MAVQFDAVGDYYNRSGNLLGTGAFTVAGWMKLDTDRNDFSCPVAVDNGSTYWDICTTSDGTTLGVDHNGTVVGASTMTAGTWHYVAATFDGATTAHFLFGTGVSGSLSDTSGTVAAGPPNTSATTWFGRDGGGAAPNFDQFLGQLAHLRVWSAALSAAELEAERLSTSAVRTANLVAAYEWASTSTTDDSGNGNTLTSNGSPTSTDSPFWTEVYPFTQADGAASGWTTLTGSGLVVVSNELSTNGTTTSNAGYRTLALTAAEEWEVQCDVDASFTIGNGGVNVWLVKSSTGEGYGFFCGNATHVQRIETGGATHTNLTNDDRADVRPVHVRMTRTAAGVMEVYLDNVLNSSWTDTTYSGPYDALIVTMQETTAPTNECTVDNLWVSNKIGVFTWSPPTSSPATHYWPELHRRHI